MSLLLIEMMSQKASPSKPSGGCVWVCVLCIRSACSNLLCSFFFLTLSLVLYSPLPFTFSWVLRGFSHSSSRFMNQPTLSISRARPLRLMAMCGFTEARLPVPWTWLWNKIPKSKYYYYKLPCKVTNLLIRTMFPRYIEYFLRQIQLLKVNGVTPYIVFDGNPLPIKSVTVDERRRYIKISPILLQ